MLQIKEISELQNSSIEALKEYESTLLKRKNYLEKLKNKGGQSWTQDLQDELNDIALALVDVSEIIDRKSKSANSTDKNDANNVYKPASGTENMIHLKIIKGHKFDPNTGKEIEKPFVQMFTYSEWRLIKNSYNCLGFTIVDILHDPYKEVESFINR